MSKVNVIKDKNDQVKGKTDINDFLIDSNKKDLISKAKKEQTVKRYDVVSTREKKRWFICLKIFTRFKDDFLLNKFSHKITQHKQTKQIKRPDK